jgi:hypothetical protein
MRPQPYPHGDTPCRVKRLCAPNSETSKVRTCGGVEAGRARRTRNEAKGSDVAGSARLLTLSRPNLRGCVGLQRGEARGARLARRQPAGTRVRASRARKARGEACVDAVGAPRTRPLTLLPSHTTPVLSPLRRSGHEPAAHEPWETAGNSYSATRRGGVGAAKLTNQPKTVGQIRRWGRGGRRAGDSAEEKTHTHLLIHRADLRGGLARWARGARTRAWVAARCHQAIRSRRACDDTTATTLS